MFLLSCLIEISLDYENQFHIDTLRKAKCNINSDNCYNSRENMLGYIFIVSV